MKQWLLVLGTIWGLSTSAIGQGTIHFANVAGPPNARTVDAPAFDYLTSERAAGAAFAAQLYAGPNAHSLEPVGAAVPFFTGAGAGYFNGGVRTIQTVAPGAPATVQVRAWQVSTGATWEEATWKGQSAVLTVITGGAGSPPSLPATLSGLSSIPIGIPEPSSFYLAACGLLAFFTMRFHRRTRSR